MAEAVQKISVIGRTFDIFILGSLAIKLGYRSSYRELKTGIKEYNEKVSIFIKNKLKSIE